jgi:hypothetical protein
MTAAGDEARLMAEYARAAGDEGLRSVALDHYLATLGHGPAHAAEILREVEELEREHLDVYIAAMVKRARAVV